MRGERLHPTAQNVCEIELLKDTQSHQRALVAKGSRYSQTLGINCDMSSRSWQGFRNVSASCRSSIAVRLFDGKNHFFGLTSAELSEPTHQRSLATKSGLYR